MRNSVETVGNADRQQFKCALKVHIGHANVLIHSNTTINIILLSKLVSDRQVHIDSFYDH